jgi:hypothetical protein
MVDNRMVLGSEAPRVAPQVPYTDPRTAHRLPPQRKMEIGFTPKAKKGFLIFYE